MNIEELKQLIKNSTSVLVLDNGEPSFVILDYKVYRDLAAEKGVEKEIKINQASNGFANGHDFHEKEAEILEKLNKEILALKNQIETEERALVGKEVD